jgi:polysaccharide deacetylase 2 family uncharacterized protein YibQ
MLRRNSRRGRRKLPLASTREHAYKLLTRQRSSLAMPLSRRLLLAGIVAVPAVAPVAIDAASADFSPTNPDLSPLGPLPAFSPAPGGPAPAAVGTPAVSAAAALPTPADGAAAAAGRLAAPPTVPAQVASRVPAWRRNAIKPPALDGKPGITIVIDDMGWVHPYTERAAALPGPLTLSWFPFSLRLPEQVGAAMARGHETTLHMPMQVHSNSTVQTGPDPLRIDLSPEVNLARLQRAFDAVPSSVGLNNHMGSVATANVPLMNLVGAETKRRGCLFLDSVVIPHSVAESCCAAQGVPSAGRDIFIDWKMRPDIIAASLQKIEDAARRYGHVIAIGHTRPMTLEALAGWLPTLPGKGFSFWPLSAAVAFRNKVDFSALHVA